MVKTNSCAPLIYQVFSPVSLIENINLCADVLYHNLSYFNLKEYFHSFDGACLPSVEVGFYRIMHRQTLFLGSPSGLALANILWDFKNKVYYLVQKTQKFIFVMFTPHFIFSIVRWKLTYFSLPSTIFTQPLNSHKIRKLCFLYPF